MRRFAASLAIGSLFLTFLGSAQAVDAGNGLSAGTGGPPWARWQGRVSVSTATPLWRSEMLHSETFGLKVQGITLMGDYYFTRSRLGEHGAGGFRATSGVLLGQGALWTSQPASGIGTGLSVGQRNTGLFSGLAGSEPTSDSTTVPYVGLGYSGLSAKGGWGFAADVGVKALHATTPVRLGRVTNGSPSLDELVRELRLTPMLQLGVSYSF